MLKRMFRRWCPLGVWCFRRECEEVGDVEESPKRVVGSRVLFCVEIGGGSSARCVIVFLVLSGINN